MQQQFLKKINISDIEGKIELRKTDVSHILDNIFSNSFSKSNQANNSSTFSVNDNSQYPLLDQTVDNQINNQDQQNIRTETKKKSFISHINKNDQEGLTYIQQTESVTKIQVKYKDKDLVLQFLYVDILKSDTKKDPLVLIMVQDVWKDLYEKKVQDIQKDKMRIFASLSHELRTPLNCSISMLEVLKDQIQSSNPGYIDEYLNPALFSNKLLLNQINDILDFVQMDSGKFKYSFLDFNIQNLLKDCQKLISMQAFMKNIQIKINCEQSVPDNICSDPNRIRQIILNFLSNSLKFTIIGYIEIGISFIQKGIYKLYVKDSGIGITKENLENLFQFCGKVNYEKKDSGLNTQGCGLGLTISNSIAKGLVKNKDIQGGISVVSEYGQGSTFSIILEDMNCDQNINEKSRELKQLLKSAVNDMELNNCRFQKSPTSTHAISYKKKYTNDYFTKEQRKGSLKNRQSLFFNNQQTIEELEKSSLEINNSFDQVDQINNQRTENLPFQEENKQMSDQKQHFTENNSKQNTIDSSVIIELDDDEQSKKTDFDHMKIQHCGKFQEDFIKELSQKSIQLNKQQSKSSSQQAKQLDSIRLADSKYYSSRSDYNQNHIKSLNNINNNQLNINNANNSHEQINDIYLNLNPNYGHNNNNNTNFIVNNVDHISNKNLDYVGQSIVEFNKQQSTESNDQIKKQMFSNLSLNFQKLNSIFKNDIPEKQNQDQEGFTSYVAHNKMAELGISSSLLIISQNKIGLSKSTTQVVQVQLGEDKILKQASICNQANHTILDEIIMSNHQKQSKCSCPQMLIVDDNQFNSYALGKTMQQLQFSYQSFSDGIQALQYIKCLFYSNCCKSPKIIFMDIEMPIKNGYEVAIEINQFYQSVQYEETPIIIACTAYVGQEDQDQAIQSGMSDYINKPILKNAFQQLIINWSHLF